MNPYELMEQLCCNDGEMPLRAAREVVKRDSALFAMLRKHLEIGDIVLVESGKIIDQPWQWEAFLRNQPSEPPISHDSLLIRMTETGWERWRHLC